MWKKLARDTLIILVLVGIGFGLYNASLMGPTREFDLVVFLAYIFGLFILTVIVIYTYWSIKRKRERKSPRKIREIQALRQNDLISEEEHLLKNQIKPLLYKLGSINMKEVEGSLPRIAFDFHKDHKYSFLHNIGIEILNLEEMKFSAILRVDYPIALSIKRRLKQQQPSSSEDQIKSSKYFIFHSSHQIAYDEIFTKKEFNDLIIDHKDSLLNFSINGKFIIGLISNYLMIEPMFELFTLIHDELMLKDFGTAEIEHLSCYQCEDIFQTNEDKCDKCGAPRPRCVVCLLDLKPSEKKKVIQTPCCEIYAHREHLISWLETNAKCPNCKQDLFLWLRTLKQKKMSNF